MGNTVGGVGHTVKDVGDTVSDLGKDTPLQGVTDTVGDTVSGLGGTVDEVAAPVTAPVSGSAHGRRGPAPVTSHAKAPKVDGAAIVRSATQLLGG